MGMKNEVSFVRFHFINFAELIVPHMKTFIKEEHFSKDFNSHIQKLITCFCELLEQVDTSDFE
jgi:hypothetical protein